MINPDKITNFKATKSELEEQIIFWVMVAGKQASLIAPRLESVLDKLRTLTGNLHGSPFELIKTASRVCLSTIMFSCGIGCYNQKAQTIIDLVEANLDLLTCTVDDLEAIKGIGPKTARCFLMHTRPNQRYAGLDVHILKFLGTQGIGVPNNTPSSPKRYRKLELAFLEIADKRKMMPAELDLEVWKSYRRK